MAAVLQIAVAAHQFFGLAGQLAQFALLLLQPLQPALLQPQARLFAQLFQTGMHRGEAGLHQLMAERFLAETPALRQMAMAHVQDAQRQPATQRQHAQAKLAGFDAARLVARGDGQPQAVGFRQRVVAQGQLAGGALRRRRVHERQARLARQQRVAAPQQIALAPGQRRGHPRQRARQRLGAGQIAQFVQRPAIQTRRHVRPPPAVVDRRCIPGGSRRD
ncbi:hypothetical protein CEK28_10485 [Xenophilus sp. AP218F]|nr:hypothetical protein CEK28_10485 [Xenophilus sp. AP218F]